MIIIIREILIIIITSVIIIFAIIYVIVIIIIVLIILLQIWNQIEFYIIHVSAGMCFQKESGKLLIFYEFKDM